MSEGLFPEPGAPDLAASPVPPLRLRRIRLQGVGPDGARFDPLDLDFATEDGAASRVLLSLTNTGGKSTLITLVCGVIVPASRAQVGGKMLGDYVLTGDTSHVVCEWEDSTSGERIVTGTVMEWKDGKRQPAHALRSTTNMYRAWYLFRTGSGLPSLDDLPFVMDGRRVPYRDFHAILGDLIAGNPGTRGVLTDKQMDWTAALEERTSVDPTLFGYQMRMNDSEAGAQKLLESFKSSNEVVRFFVAALNDQRELESFTSKLESYAQLAARRDELEALADWGAETTPLIARIATCAAVAATATASADRAHTLGGELATALSNRIDQDQRIAQVLDGTASEARTAAARARRAYGQVSDIRLQLQLDQARADLMQAQEKHEHAELAATAAECHEEAWKTVDVIIDLQTRRTELAVAQEAYDTADAGLGPLRDQMVGAAARFAGRLAGLITENKEAAAAAGEAAEVATEQVDVEMAKSTAAATRVSRLKADLDTVDKAVAAADAAREDAVRQGLLTADERPDAGVRRWTDTRAEATRAATAANAAAEEADASYGRAIAQLTKLEPLLVERHTAMTAARERLNGFDEEVTALVADPIVHELHGGEPSGADAVPRWITLAGTAANTADATAARHEAIAGEARTEIAYLDDHGTAPTGADVQAVLDALNAERVWSVTGLDWIERNVVEAEERKAFIEANPNLAGGVIITDPNRFDAGVATLGACQPRTRTPVTVTVAPASAHETQPTDDGFRPFIVVPHRATWDRAWAEQHRDELAATEQQASTAATAAKEAAARYRATSAACSTFTRHWGTTPRATLVEAAETTTAEHTATDDRVRTERSARDTAHELAKTKRDERDGWHEKSRRAGRIAEQLESARQLVAAAEREIVRRPAIVGELIRARRDQEAAEQAVRDALQLSKAEAGKAAQHRANLEPLRRELTGLGIDRTSPDPGGNVHVLRSAWNAVQGELARVESGLPEAARLKDARTRFGEATERLRHFSEEARAAAEELAGTVEASTQATRLDAVERAIQASRAARGAALTAENRLGQARATVRDAEPADDRQNHFDLAGTEWRWLANDEIAALLDRLETRNAELLVAREEAEAAVTEAEELREEVHKDMASFTDTVGLWVAERTANVDIYTGNREVARTEMRKRIKEQQATDQAARSASKELDAAVAKARAVANKSRWARLTVPAVMRLRELPDTDLIAEADLLGKRMLAMSESAAADLKELDQHRAILRDSLQSLCREQRRLLREVSRSSRLPDGLGDLTHKPAIKILFEEAPDDEAATRLARRVDTWAVELDGDPKRARSAEIRARWLADAVRDTVVDRSRAGAWSIEILKPSIDGHVIYCPPDRIPAEFSGGQVLTLAVLVYCALSRVRSAHRQGGVRPPGTLILDNPFGAASAEALIEMQHRLAAHSGVQLVCATGLHDPAVDAAFTGPRSVIVKLRNDGDLRRNLSYLRLRAIVVDGVDVAERVRGGRSREDSQNWVDATRYEVR
jgi:hypothetical protein